MHSPFFLLINSRRKTPLRLFLVMGACLSLRAIAAWDDASVCFAEGISLQQAHAVAVSAPRPERLPDPRYRLPLGIWEIDRVASMVAKATGRKIRGKIYVSDQLQAPFASVCGPVIEGKIVVNPRAAVEVPPNSWAFVIGHEFAHQIYGFGSRSTTDPEQEFRADKIGAGYAIQAGFDLAAHVAWVLLRPDGGDALHGSRHERAFRLAAQFGITRSGIERHMSRHQAASGI
ncbi:MAG: hypothetical protein WCH98_20465 [Verrucomicrobiota bacterium]